jgi:hypothetical protein
MLLKHRGDYADYLRDRGAELIGESGRPSQITIRPIGTAIIATLSFGARSHRVVLKRTTNNASIRSSSQLAGILNSLRAAPDLQSALPAVLGFDDGLHLIALAWVEGHPLSTAVRSYIKDGGVAPAADLAMTGHLVSRIQQVDGALLIGDDATRSPMTFLGSFDHEPRLFHRANLEAGFSSAEQYWAQFSRPFLESRGRELFLIDGRPKNTIVRTDASPCFIDLDFAAAPVGIGIAAFLVALDRLGIWYRSQQQQWRLTQLQREFVRGYASSTAYLAEHVGFFYPWTLLEMLRQHATARPLLRPWLRMYYRARLERFLLAVRNRGGITPTISPAEWFDPDTALGHSRLGSMITWTMGTLGRLRT